MNEKDVERSFMSILEERALFLRRKVLCEFSREKDHSIIFTR